MKNHCSEPNCPNEELCLSLCSMHYQRMRKHGDTTIKLTSTKDDPCSKCKINKRRDTHSWCQLCLNESGRKWNASQAGPRYRRYRLTKSDIAAKKLLQNNRCAICNDSFDIVKDHVDHDGSCCNKKDMKHGNTCGKCVRDLLCGSCNQGLGNFKDSKERLQAAILYLEKWEVA